MIQVSQAFIDRMNTYTDFRNKAEIYLSDGTTLTLNSTKFNLTGNSLDDAGGVNTLPLGVAICRTISLNIDNSDEAYTSYDFYGAEIYLYMTFSTFPDVLLGKFTVTTPATYGDAITLSAVDDMWKANQPYTSELDYESGVSLRQIFVDACLSCDLMVGSTTFANNTYVVYKKPEGYTFREVFGFIAMLAGGNARISTQNYVEILSYHFPSIHYGAVADYAVASVDIADDETETPHVTSSDYTLRNWESVYPETDDITITGLVIDSDEGEVVHGSLGYVLKLDNPLIKGAEAAGLALIAYYMVGATFRKFHGRHISYPIAEFMDAVTIVDRKGNEYRTVLTDVNISFGGFTEFSNSAETAIRNNSKISDNTKKLLEKAKAEAVAEAVSEAAQDATQKVSGERSAREVAIANLNQTIAGVNGMYTTAEVQTDGSTVWYLHNQPVKNTSSVIVKVSAEAIALSTDGGASYLYGVQMNGDAITRILMTEGINADWINAGALTIRDDYNNILFQADMESNSVTISGSCVTIGNKTASDVKGEVDQLASYITYQDGKLTLGKEGWSTQFVLENDQISAMLDGEVISFWNIHEHKTPKQLTIPVGGNLRLGDFQWTPRTTGNVSLLWVGA